MTNEHEINPHIGVGPVRLGMSCSEARSMIAVPFRSFKKSSTDVSLTDAYFNNCFQLFFDEADVVNYIELSNPIKALYKGIPVFDSKAEVIIAAISLDAAVEQSVLEPGYSFLFPSLDLSLWRPTIPEPDQAEQDNEGRYFMTIGIGRIGYFSR